MQIQFGGRNHTFLNVYYILGMELNLLSMNQIMQHFPQLDVVFTSHKFSIVDWATRTTMVVGVEIMVYTNLWIQVVLLSMPLQLSYLQSTIFGINSMVT